MSKTIFPWIKPLGLSSEDFSEKPEGENPLVWGLQNQVIDENEFSQWASAFYQLPSIKSEFFRMGVDFSLLKKHQHVFKWSSTCYPLYEWQDILFVACLEPPRNGLNTKSCFIISPFTPMVSAWAKQNELQEKLAPMMDQPTVEQASIPDLPEEPNIAAPQEDVEAPREPIDTPVVNAKTPPLPSMDSLDFSGLDSFQNDDSPEPEVESAPPPFNEDEITGTVIDSAINHQTSATQTMYNTEEKLASLSNEESPENAENQGDAEDQSELKLSFDNLDISSVSLEGEPNPPAEVARVIPVAKQTTSDPQEIKANPQEKAPVDLDLPGLEDLVAQKTDTPPQAPGVVINELETEVSKDVDSDSDSGSGTESEIASQQAFEDQYTPVTIITKAQQEAMVRKKEAALKSHDEKEKAKGIENTLTDHSQPVSTPNENKITDTDLQICDELENCKDRKAVLSHIFSHLKKDYQKLMWLEKKNEQLFFPQYVYGEWKILELAWKMHVNLKDPNIFRIAFNSGLPFHGEINPNPYNDKYLEWWTRGRNPDFITIAPVSIEDEIIGFIVCSDKNKDFDELASLKKIENLISLCKTFFAKYKPARAA